MSEIALKLALVGAPNAGKSTLFNGLTGGRAKTANYPGVTVETRWGAFTTPAGRKVELVDLPGVYGLTARSMDERVAIEALEGKLEGRTPDALLVLVDAGLLRSHLHSVLQLKALGRPMMVVLNMIDLAERDGVEIDAAKLEQRLGVPVVVAASTRRRGRAELLDRLDGEWLRLSQAAGVREQEARPIHELQREAREIAREAIVREPPMNRLTRAIDSVVLHPVAGPLILASILFLMFQAVYAWAQWPMDQIDAGFTALGVMIAGMPGPAWLHSFLADGVIAGVGSVVVFLPQIVILFAFILALEGTGYMARAAFLMDELMLRVGLNGRAFIPLLSSFACAIPGIMAARTIENERDRLTTILVAPLMTCSARIPVYTLIIGAFIPRQYYGPVNLQGIVMFVLYLTGIVSAVTVAFILKRTVTKGATQALLLELPTYKLPSPQDFLVNLWMRARAFLKRAGTIIFSVVVALWFLASLPPGAGVRGSFAGMLGGLLEPIIKPIGFNLEIAIALIPGMAAREVAVGALGTVYALNGSDDVVRAGLTDTLQNAWPLPTALAFLAWYVFAPQCISTIAVARRETNSWGWAMFMVAYLFALAYVAAGATYWIARAAGL